MYMRLTESPEPIDAQMSEQSCDGPCSPWSAAVIFHLSGIGESTAAIERVQRKRPDRKSSCSHSKLGKVDPDKTFELGWVCANTGFVHKDAKPLEHVVKSHTFYDYPCDFVTGLEAVTHQALRSNSPVSIYVLTNGRWNCRIPPTADGVDIASKDINSVEILIKNILVDNRSLGRLSNHVGIKFIGFYEPNNIEDEAGRKRLEYLDDSLESTFAHLDPGIVKRDIIDTVDWDGDVCKMLLGGVFSDED
ncbi:hypothetical protein QBC35DRAFT_477360 [Podospora australis]|uniref:Uncharacterized protein n=1 Tax=Podospora australis TaxID=1536484 RepID=A0AAN6WLJ7_9PEZI|nr:hypothetical protein QBC35DRAFT_477360 [Podospora australis]